jgi:hypothetical protein
LTLVVIPTLYYMFPGSRGITSIEAAATAAAAHAAARTVAAPLAP